MLVATQLIGKLFIPLNSTRIFYRVPHPQHYPYAVVCNLDPARKKGTHWVAMFAKSKHLLWYFDSYGEGPPTALYKLLREHDRVVVNKFVIQSLISDVCGWYCIYFIHQACNNMSYDGLLFRLARKQYRDEYVRGYGRQLVNI